MTSYTNAIDWCGVGIVMYECVVGRLPFADSKSEEGLFQKILNHEPTYPSNLSPAALDLIKHDFWKKNQLNGKQDKNIGIMINSNLTYAILITMVIQ